MGERLFGGRVRRREDGRLITGHGRYVADVVHPGLLHVAVHRSPHAHARIVRVDPTEARRRPGVVHVLVPKDVSALGRLPLLVPHASLVAPACPEILPQEIVSYAGQAVALVIAEHAARVVTQDIGGGFGPKAIVYAEDILIPFLARALGRAVRFVEARREHFLSVTQERDQWHDVELGLTREGRIVAIRDSFVHDCGAFVSWGVIVPILTSVSVPGPYRVPNYEVTLTALYTNRVPVTPVRGAGRPQAVFVMERMLDLAAGRLGIDRVAIRARNLIQPDEFPYDVGLISRDNSPRRYDSGNYPECLRRVAEAVGAADFAAERERARAAGRAIGLGFALFVEDTGLGPYEC